MNEMKIQMVDKALEFAKSTILKDGHLFPCFHAYAGDKVIIIATPWGNEAEKVRALQMVKILFQAEEVERYLMLSETWVKECKGKEEFEQYRKQGKQPSEYNDKFEAVQVLYVDREEKALKSFQMHRDAAGKLTHLTPYRGGEAYLQVSGRMTDLLPSASFGMLTTLQRDIAKEILKKFSYPKGGIP